MRKKSFQDKIDKRRNSDFIGRENEIIFFEKNLSMDSNALEHQNIIFVSGIGGIGKTTLLRKFMYIAKQEENIVAYIDEDVKSIEGFMHEILSQFHEDELNNNNNRFENIYKEIIQTKSQQVISEQESESLNLNKIKSLQEPTNKITVLQSIETEKLYKALSKEFIEILYSIKERRKICFFIDTYEVVKSVIGDWLINFISEDYGEIPVNILFTIASRNSYAEDGFQMFSSLTQQIHLDSFSMNEAVELLKRKGVSDSENLNSIYKLTKGIPVLLSLLAENSHEDIEKSVFDEIRNRIGRNDLDSATDSLFRLVKSKELKNEEKELEILIMQMRYFRNEIVHNRIELNFAEREKSKIINSILSFVARIEKHNF